MKALATTPATRAVTRRKNTRVQPVRLVEVMQPRRHRVWLPLPLSILWVLLAPFAVFLSLFAGLAPRPWRIDGPTAAWRIGETLFALSGTIVEIKSREADVYIRIF